MSDSSPPGTPGTRAAAVTGVVVAALVAVAVLLWSKWLPYTGTTLDALASSTWDGSDVLAVGGVRPGDPPSWQAGVSFVAEYGQAVWKALVAALLIGAAVQSLVPHGWLLRLLNRRAGWRARSPAGWPARRR